LKIYRNKKIIEYLSKAFNETVKKDIKLCELGAKSLKNVVTTKKEKKKDINFSKMPESNLTPIDAYLSGNRGDSTTNSTFSNDRDVEDNLR
jgi:hypothetical protein